MGAAIVAAFILSCIIVHPGRKADRSHRQQRVIEGLNTRLTNSMSDSLGLERLDRDVNNFMSRWSIRGLSIAITRNDSLLFAKGYGLADEPKGEEMTPGHILRLASVSKLITATGIMKLCDEGKLSLNDKVFGPDGILCDTAYTNAIKDQNYFKITVEHLLRHEAGLSVRAGDPMFSTRDIMIRNHLDTPPDSKTLTRLMVQRRLQFEPGSGSHEYSNFGYLLLSMIIEQITGQDYETWMQENILKPTGCVDFHLAHNSYEEKYPNEVRYHMQENDPLVAKYDNSPDSVVRCYGGNNIHALYGAGAWVASAPEVALFIASIDGKPEIPDIISHDSAMKMANYGIGDSEDKHPEHKYGLGWNTIDERGWLRTGTLSGTTAFIMLYPDGECWVMLSNTHNWKGPRFVGYERAFLNECRTRYSDKLPKRDLFY